MGLIAKLIHNVSLLFLWNKKQQALETVVPTSQ